VGHFSVPRDCTLAPVAAELEVDTSTASETIRRGVAKVPERFLSTRHEPTGRWGKRVGRRGRPSCGERLSRPWPDVWPPSRYRSI